MSDAGFWVGADPPYREILYSQHGPGGTHTWQSWIKPRGVQFVYMLAIGGGGGGGGGLTGAASAARGGGGGGGCGGVWKMMAPAQFLPERMWIAVGKGGAGSTGSGVAGTAGQQTYLAGYPAVTTPALYGTSGNGNGGAAGTGSGAAAGGTTTAANQYQGIGQTGMMVVLTAGSAAAAGGAATGAVGANYGMGAASNNGLCGGAGGAGTTSADFAGGDQATANSFFIQSVTGGAAGTNNGKAGLWLPTSQFGFFATGGSGGGASNTAAGGAGGPGAYGCGGGGGGGGTTGGAGGAGGDGLVIITAW